MATEVPDLPALGEDYPFDHPVGSFLFDKGRYVEQAIAEDDLVGSGRQPVMALGSNAAPAQLKRKFGTHAAPIPVTRVVLHDQAIVYSAHFTQYGSLPATLAAHEGALAFCFITWLLPEQLALMHGTEALGRNYDFVVHDRLDARTQAGSSLSGIGIYVSRAGPMIFSGRPIRLAEMPVSGSSLPALTQPAARRFVWRRLAPETPFDAFASRLVADKAFRQQCSARLERLSCA